jgi:hypothetical protein
MQISNINSTNNSYNKSKLYFTGSGINWKKVGTLAKEELDVMQNIRRDFDIASMAYINLNDAYQAVFKNLYPDIFSTKKLRGFTFHVQGGKGLQLQKTHNAKNSQELLTFSVINPAENSKLHFKVNNNGDYYVSDADACINKIPKDKLKGLNKIGQDMSLLRRYAQNFTTIRKKIEHSKEPLSAKEVLKRMEDAASFDGYKQEAENLAEKFRKVNTLLYKNQTQAAHLKEEFFGQYFKKAKGWTFRAEDGSNITLCPTAIKWADTKFYIVKTDKTGERKAFLFFTDGKIASPVVIGGDRALDLRPHNLDYLAPKDLEENGIEGILKFLDKKIDEFEYYILVRRGKTPEQIALHQKVVEERKKIFAKARMEKFKAAKEARIKAGLEAPKPKRKRGRPRKVVENTINTETKPEIKVQTQHAKVAQAKLVAPKNFSDKPTVSGSKVEQKPVAQKQIVKQAKTDKYNIYKDTNFEKVVNSLQKILETPAYKRSPHLIHERLSKGRIFEGRFMINAKDGSKVAVSRVKSNKFFDFTYISLRVTKSDGTMNVMNIDPSRMMIIDSVNGTPRLDKYGDMDFLTPLEFLHKNPWAADIPKYMEEILSVEKGAQAKVIEIQKPKKSQAELLAEAEREVQRALRQFEKDDDFFSNF